MSAFCAVELLRAATEVVVLRVLRLLRDCDCDRGCGKLRAFCCVRVPLLVSLAAMPLTKPFNPFFFLLSPLSPDDEVCRLGWLRFIRSF